MVSNVNSKKKNFEKRTIQYGFLTYNLDNPPIIVQISDNLMGAPNSAHLDSRG